MKRLKDNKIPDGEIPRTLSQRLYVLVSTLNDLIDITY